MTRMRRKPLFGAPPNREQPPIVTMSKIAETDLARVLRFMPTLLAGPRAVCGIDDPRLQGGPLCRQFAYLESDAEKLFDTFGEVTSFIEGRSVKPPRRNLSQLVESFFTSFHELIHELEQAAKQSCSDDLTFAARGLACGDAARHFDADGVVRVYPVA